MDQEKEEKEKSKAAFAFIGDTGVKIVNHTGYFVNRLKQN